MLLQLNTGQNKIVELATLGVIKRLLQGGCVAPGAGVENTGSVAVSVPDLASPPAAFLAGWLISRSSSLSCDVSLLANRVKEP